MAITNPIERDRLRQAYWELENAAHIILSMVKELRKSELDAQADDLQVVLDSLNTEIVDIAQTISS